MKIKVFLLFLGLSASVYTFACTNFMAGKNATIDGSTLLTYAADSYTLYGALQLLPAADHKEGDMRKIIDWDSGKYLGEIPEVAHTYSVVGNMNEHQVSIGETTFGGRHELVDTTAIIDYGSLIYIALQRSKTAREAINTMTSLVEKYGYYSEGESFSIADPQEIWIMEMVGKGTGGKGAVWVAARVPDDMVCAHANQARIDKIDFKDKKNWLYSKDVVSFAREKGWYEGKDKDFSFCDTYCPADMMGLYGCEGRVWSFFRKVNKDIDAYLPYILGESKQKMPLFVKPERLLSAQDFKDYMRDMYEDTPLDIMKGTDAGPWHSKLRYGTLGFKLDSVQYWFERPIATQQTGWSFVAQMRSYAKEQAGGIFWFGVDDAATNVYIPIYSNITAVPWCLSPNNGDLITYSSTAAFWVFNAVANFAYSKYDAMLPDIRNRQQMWEQYFNDLVVQTDNLVASMSLDEAKKHLTRFSAEQAEKVTASWRELGQYLLVKYLDGQQKREKNGKFERTKEGECAYPLRPTYNEDYLRLIAPEIRHE